MERTNRWNIITKYLDLLEDSPILYHYTNVYGLEGIMKHKELWVSNADFLNDKTERKYTEKILFNLIEEKLKDNKMKDLIMDTLTIALDMTEFPTYVLSLSINKDSNLLWSNYSQDDGYNISFDFETLEEIGDSLNSSVFKSKVIYEEEIHYEALNELADYCVAAFSKSKPNYEELVSEVKVVHTSLQLLASFFKNSSFQQEEEYRIVLIQNTENEHDYECRVSNGTFIPYIKMKFNKNNVKGITIGPKNKMDISEEGLKSFLTLNKFNVETIEINRSKIPYRY
ncbi:MULTISPECIES: DUF2971 domain-containing protein [Bacillus]|uniref:DUF2971 domain-containing protein n=1 Tax=Bacillus TaxID=1386 RepID=UPI0006F9DF58|nr:DUF2971 domain-containing protein [Bacillus sp. Root920]KRE13704.1 hypothetical protein ASE42_15225 [Bacillus sp. Root920]